MKILGIDYGDKRIGLAVAKNGWIKPIEPIANDSTEKVIEAIKKLVKDSAIEIVVLGMPRPLKTNSNERLSITEIFGKKLGAQISIPLEFTSEIFTTKLARAFSLTKKQRKNIDSRAACFILEQYLKNHNP